MRSYAVAGAGERGADQEGVGGVVGRHERGDPSGNEGAGSRGRDDRVGAGAGESKRGTGKKHKVLE